MNKVTLFQAIKKICKAADLKYRVDKYAVVIAPPKVYLQDLIMRVYPMDGFSFTDPEQAEPVAKFGVIDVQTYFKRRGVRFPEGSILVFDVETGQLIAINTYGNLKKIERLIDCLCVIDPLVIIESKYVKIAQEDFEQIKNEYESSSQESSLWKKVLYSDKTETLASASVLTQNGEEATIRMVKEVFFPESWNEGVPDPGDFAKLALKRNRKQIVTQVLPEFGEPTELGIRMTVTPTVDPDKNTVLLDALPVIQQHVGWTYSKDSQAEKMSIIKAFTSQNQVTLHDGEPYLASSFVEDVKTDKQKERQRNCFMLFYTVRLINPDGSPLRNNKGELNPAEFDKLDISPAEKSKNVGSLEKRLSELIFPQLKFENVNIFTAVKYLAEYSKEKQPPAGFNIALGMTDYELERVPTITLDLHDIPFLDVLKYVCLMTGLKLRIYDQVVTIGTDCLGIGETRFLKVRGRLIERCVEACLTDEEMKTYAGDYGIKVTSKMLKDYFSMRGIPFPEWTYIAYDRRASKLVVKNTAENLDRLDYLLMTMDLEVPQASIEMTSIGISERDLIQLIGKDGADSEILTSKQIEKIINSDKGTVLSSQQIVAKSGDEEVFRSVEEQYLPTKWLEGFIDIKEGQLFPMKPMPEFKKPTDFGDKFIVTPTISPNQYTMTLHINTCKLKIIGTTEYDWSYAINGNKNIDSIKLPKVSRRDLVTNTRIYDGRTLCIGRSRYRSFLN